MGTDQENSLLDEGWQDFFVAKKDSKDEERRRRRERYRDIHGDRHTKANQPGERSQFHLDSQERQRLVSEYYQQMFRSLFEGEAQQFYFDYEDPGYKVPTEPYYKTRLEPNYAAQDKALVDEVRSHHPRIPSFQRLTNTSREKAVVNDSKKATYFKR